MPTGAVLDRMCLSNDGSKALGGVPKGCAMAWIGPPGRGKTRMMLVALCRVVATGTKVGLVVAGGGFHDADGIGREDLCSRLTKIGMVATELAEDAVRTRVLENVYVLENQHHKGRAWDGAAEKHRYLMEKEKIESAGFDSLNMLAPTKHLTADNLSALKTYNHERGVTAACIGQTMGTGMPVGGEALMHTADAMLLIEEMALTGKDMAALWRGPTASFVR